MTTDDTQDARLRRAMDAIRRLAWTDVWLADSVARVAGVSVHRANSLLHGRMRGCTAEQAEAVLAAIHKAYEPIGGRAETRRIPFPRRKS